MRLVRIKLLIFLTVVFLLPACAIKPRVTTDYDINFDFSHLKNYVWLPSNSEKVTTLDNKRQVNAIETVLSRKGFNKVSDVVNADFILKTHTLMDKKTNINSFYQTWGYYPYFHSGAGYGHSYGWPSNAYTSIREYKIGTFVLDIVDPVKKQVVWRGSVSKSLGIYKNRTPEERTNIVISNAEFMLDSFPPSPEP